MGKLLTWEEVCNYYRVSPSKRKHLVSCCCHADTTPSLSISDVGGQLLVHCFAGCSARHILTCLRSEILSGRQSPRLSRSVSKHSAWSPPLVSPFGAEDYDTIAARVGVSEYDVSLLQRLVLTGRIGYAVVFGVPSIVVTDPDVGSQSMPLCRSCYPAGNKKITWPKTNTHIPIGWQQCVARLPRPIIICEGISDYISLAITSPYVTACAMLGAACRLDEGVASVCRSFEGRVYSAYDNDDAGVKGTTRLMCDGILPLLIPSDYNDLREWIIARGAAEIHTQLRSRGVL